MLGADPLLFGTDMTLEGGVGKILGANLTEVQRDKVFWRNAIGILSKRDAQ